MTNPDAILRDSAILLALMTLGGALAGLDWGAGILAGGGIALFNLFLISRMVARLTAGEAKAAAMGFGLLLKTGLSLAGIWLALRWLHAPAVLLGLGTVISAIALRAGLSLFAAPTGASRA